MAPNLPPVELTDTAMRLASTLLQIAVDPNATSARLAELAAQTQALRDAIAQHEAAAAKAAEVEARETAAATRELNVLAREQAVANAATAVDVSAAANVARSKGLDDREVELAKREQEHAAKVKANEDRIASVRASLA
jgi:septal ring factor EnvC (AmiA/AmiB activator)